VNELLELGSLLLKFACAIGSLVFGVMGVYSYYHGNINQGLFYLMMAVWLG
jgi:hypothetical protein